MKLGISFLAALWLVLVAASWAEGAQTATQADDEYNFSWLDPDKKIHVLQNRKFLKADHLLVSAIGGLGFSSPYRTTLNVQPRIAYYLSETFGIETFYTYLYNSENNTFGALRDALGTAAMPVVREVRSQYGLLAHYSPWYAKLNVFNKIVYFDWYFSGGAGVQQCARDARARASDPAVYVTEANQLTYFAGTGHQYHLTQDFSLRLDLTGSFYNAPLVVADGNAWFANYLVAFGVGYRL